MTEPKARANTPAPRRPTEGQGFNGFAHSGARSIAAADSRRGGQSYMEKVSREPFPANTRLQKQQAVPGAALGYKEPYLGCIDGFDATGILGKILGTNMFGGPNRGMAQALCSQIGSKVVEVKRRVEYHQLIAGIEKAHAEGRPIVIAAHSMANNHVVEALGKELAAKGIRINVFIMCDASYLDEKYPFQPGSRQIPANVDHVICLTSDGPFQGKPITRDLFANRATTFETHTMSKVFNRSVHHEDYKDPQITAWIAGRVKEALGGQHQVQRAREQSKASQLARVP